MDMVESEGGLQYLSYGDLRASESVSYLRPWTYMSFRLPFCFSPLSSITAETRLEKEAYHRCEARCCIKGVPLEGRCASHRKLLHLKALKKIFYKKKMNANICC